MTGRSSSPPEEGSEKVWLDHAYLLGPEIPPRPARLTASQYGIRGDFAPEHIPGHVRNLVKH